MHYIIIKHKACDKLFHVSLLYYDTKLILHIKLINKFHVCSEYQHNLNSKINNDLVHLQCRKTLRRGVNYLVDWSY